MVSSGCVCRSLWRAARLAVAIRGCLEQSTPTIRSAADGCQANVLVWLFVVRMPRSIAACPGYGQTGFVQFRVLVRAVSPRSGDSISVVSILGSFEVHSPAHGKSFKIDIVDGLDSIHLDCIEQQWRPLIDRQYKAALLQYFLLPEASQNADAFRNILATLGIPDEHWDWRKKCSFAPATNRKPYAILCGDQVEAVMMLEFGRKARLGTAGAPLVYVDYVSAAPWNRGVIQSPERFQGLGTMMMGTVVAISRMLNCDGRCGLHSLPSAEGFYRRIGMTELDVDPSYHNLRYYEFDEQASRVFTG